MTNFSFPLAIMANMLAMTAILILVSLAGLNQLAADIGIAQAATAALFFAFSANARPAILATSSSALAKSIFDLRLILLIPLSLGAFWLTSTLAGVETYLAGVLILRRAVEWLVEINLSEKERLEDKRFALVNAAVQIMLFMLVAIWLLMKMPYPLFGLFLWAFIPLLFSARFFLHSLATWGKDISSINRKMAPHFGSSFAIGISLYVFRLLMIAILGQEASGSLFAAFAIGGVLGSIFVNAFGPSIAFNEKKNGAYRFPRVFTFLLWGLVVAGGLVYGLSYFAPNLFQWLGKEGYFWQAVGLSMIGGVIMVHAQLLRNRLLIHNETHDLWGPDLLMNILIIAAVPLAFFFYGFSAIAGLSLLSASLAWVFYRSSERRESAIHGGEIAPSGRLQQFATILIISPVFFNFEGGLFNAVEIPQTGNSTLMSLPVPVSLLSTYIGILLIGRYRAARLTIGTMFFSFIAMVFTTLVVAEDSAELDFKKLILIIQYVLPMGALVLGEMFKANELDVSIRIEKTFLVILALIVPLQLVTSWVQSSDELSGHLYVFSIYQHLDYVPMVFASAYLMVLFALWQEEGYRRALLILSPLMGIYVAASLSLTAMVFLTGGIGVFAITRWRTGETTLPTGMFFAVLAAGLVYLNIQLSSMSLAERLGSSWNGILTAGQYYVADIEETLKAFMLGHGESVDRLKFASAHNYYLDVIRNFGVLSIIPVLVLIGHTIRSCYTARRNIYSNPVLLGHVAVLSFMLVIDNSTQISLRQPFPGVFTYFIWGLLLARLNRLLHIKEI